MIDNSKQKATRGTSGILSEADAGTAFSSVIDTVLVKSGRLSRMKSM